eukprot:m.167692 g.167692  ORF g.167692 m.167692 type:complete len:351 (+) comp14466_c1_seq11:184-1236(+)
MLVLVVLFVSSAITVGKPLTATHVRDSTEPHALGDRCPSNQSLEMVHSRYHGAVHCKCPRGESCVGRKCSVGQYVDGALYHNAIHGFEESCADCKCVQSVSVDTISDFRQSHTLWILGTHHKTGSFLTQRIWGGLHSLVNPPLNVHSSQFRPLDAHRWSNLPQDVDVVVTFQAENINSTITQLTGRPYKFVHMIRDPVRTVVSAYLYETQRADANDRYHRIIVPLSLEEGVLAMAEYMQDDLLKMEDQFKQAAADHNALNVKLEDFTANFDDTIERIYRFLGVPAAEMDKFVASARLQDLSRKKADELSASDHVTRGKYDKEPLISLVETDKRFAKVYKRMKELMGYSDL